MAVSLGAGGWGLAQASLDSGERPVTVTITPERLLDTRSDLGLAGKFVSAAPRDLQVTGSVPVASGGSKSVVPADAVAVIVNVTVVRPSERGFLSLRPAGAAGAPTTSTVNFTANSVSPNSATVDLGSGGRVQIYLQTDPADGTADVLLDVVGYTIDHTHDDRYYTEPEVDAAIAEVDAAVAEVDAAVAEVDAAVADVAAEVAAVAEARPARVVTVATAGGDFTSVSSALASITDASATAPYVIDVAPGVYVEPSGIDLKSHVDIRGSGRNVTKITSTSSATSSATVRATGTVIAELSGLTVENTGGGSTAIGVLAEDVPGQSLRFTELDVIATDAGNRRGIQLEDAGAAIHDVSLSAFGGSSSIALYLIDAASVDASDMIAGANAGMILSGTGGSARIHDSRFSGFPLTVINQGLNPVFLIGVGVSSNIFGPAACVGSYVTDTGAPLAC